MNVMRLAARAVLVLIVGLAMVATAHAQTPRCGGYADVLADLHSAYHERIVWIGERGPAGQMVITARADGSTWTAVIVQAGIACLVSAGTGWVAPAPGEDI